MVTSIDISTIQLILLIGGAQSFLFSFFFTQQFRNNKGDLLLAILFFVIAFRLVVYPFIKSDFFYTYTLIPRLSDTLLLSIGPVIYLYTLEKLSLRDLLGIRWSKALHFIPLLYFLVTVFTDVAPIFNKSHVVLFLTIVYALISMALIVKHEFDAVIPRVKIRLYRQRLIRFILPFFLIPGLIVGLIKYSHDLFGFGAATIPYVIISVIFYRMTFMMMVKGKPYLNAISPKLSAVTFSPKDLEGSPKVGQLISFMENQKPYLDPNLNLSTLAQQYGKKKHELSVLINKDLNVGFNDFINYWRVETAKKYLMDDAFSHLTISGLGYQSGFKSKSTFFESFKKYTGMTPSQYLANTKSTAI